MDMAILVTSKGAKTFTTFQLEKFREEVAKYPTRPTIVDFHNVLDRVPPTTLLCSGMVCLSFVKRTSHYMREKTTREIQARIGTKQLQYGVIVFERGKEEEKYNFMKCGSKAWFCKLVKATTFVDDSLDHAASVRHHCQGINTILVREGNITKKESKIPGLSNIVETISVQPSLQHCFLALGEKRDDGFNKHEKRFKRFCENNTALLKAGFRVTSHYPCSEEWESQTHIMKILPMQPINHLYVEDSNRRIVGAWSFQNMRDLQDVVKDAINNLKICT